jgi:hypothetical protein
LYVPLPFSSVEQLLIASGFDRDLGVAGRVMTRANDGTIVQKLVKVDRPSMFIFEDSSSPDFC